MMIESKHQPKSTNVTWIDLSGETPTEKHFINGRWVAVSSGVGGSIDISGKVDKVANATPNNFASFDENGGIKDSGFSDGSFATAAQGTKADSAIQGVQVNGSDLTPDANKKVNILPMTGATSSSAGSAGLVPAPTAGDDEKILQGDGTWVTKPTNGKSAYDIWYEENGYSDPTTYNEEYFLASLKAQFGSFVPADYYDDSGGSDEGKPASSGSVISPDQSTTNYIYLVDNNSDPTSATAKVMWITVVDETDPSNPTYSWQSIGEVQVSLLFKSCQSLDDVNIVNDLTTGGANDVASADTVKTIADTTMELVRVVEGLNILDPDLAHSMIKLDRRIKQDGTEDDLNSATQDTIYGCTDYIEITDEGLILNHGVETISTSAYGCIVYNASKQKVGRKSVSTNGNPLAITPTSSSQGSGTNYVPATNSGETVEDLVPKYVRFNLYKPATPYDGTNDGYAIYKGTTLPDPEYQPYGSYTEEWKQKSQVFGSGEKINEVTIEDVPAQDSDALITSGGIFEALKEVYETIDEAISVEDEYEVVTATRLTGLRPSSENNTFISVASTNYLYYLKVNKDDKVKITATNSSAKTVVFCFSSNVPILDGSLTNYDERSVTAIDEVFTAPYNGYFCFYHNSSYFSDQVFQKTKINGKFTAKITLEGGGIVVSGSSGQYSVPGEPVVCGYTSGGEFVTGVDDFMNNYRTPLYIKANKVLDVEVDEGESFRIFCYNAELTYLGASETNSNQVLNGTEYIKIVVSKSTAYDAGRVLVFNACCENGELVEVFNKPAKSTITSFNSFSFEIKEAITNDEYTDSVGDAYITTNRHWDNGCIKLPPNYSPFGQPVPLIVFWHGTDGFSFSTPMSSYPTQITFLNNQGYAVCDCSGMTDRYYIGADAVTGHDCRFNQLAISCFCNLYWHVTKNYNVRRDGCFVFGKSNGGLGTAFLGITKPFPIKAIATLAGSLSIVQSMRYSSYTNLTYWLDRLGLDSTVIPQYTGMFGTHWDEPEFANSVDYITNNADKFNRIDPMLMMTTIDSSDFADAMLNCAYSGIGDSEELNSIISSHWKIQSTPMKIWHAINDTAVPIAISRFYRDLVNKANGICYLREIPAVSTNGHHAVDNADDAPKVQVTTRFGGSTEIAVAYAEMCEWFDRFL